jgi:hypothetical protein
MRYRLAPLNIVVVLFTIQLIKSIIAPNTANEPLTVFFYIPYILICIVLDVSIQYLIKKYIWMSLCEVVAAVAAFYILIIIFPSFKVIL